MIDAKTFEILISAFDVGTATAEKDPLLPVAQIRTQEFDDLWCYDRIDIIRGIKGSGKTALYRVFSILKEKSEEYNLFCIFGVEDIGDPVFKKFKKHFSKFTSAEFESFWSLYFLSLIRAEIEQNKKLHCIIENKKHADQLEVFWQQLDVPYDKEKKSLYEIVNSVIEHFKVSMKVETNPTGSITYKPEIDIGLRKENVDKGNPIYVGDFRETVCNLLAQKKYRIWIMLDRLDEVFQRLSKVEENGLKGLLKAAYNFSKPELRIKVFLRDDIIRQLANSEDGFTALTHVTDRASNTMRWTKDNILLLVVKRIFAHSSIQKHYSIDTNKLDNDSKYRESCFYQVFPKKIGKLPTLDWMMNVLADGNGIVTPRDVIGILNFAKSTEFKKFQLEKKDKEHLISVESLKKAFEDLSIEKKDNFLMAEFPHMRDNILKLEGSYSIHTAQSLENMYGTNWNKIVANFKSIGLIKHYPQKGYYKIPKLWIKGLGITQGKA